MQTWATTVSFKFSVERACMPTEVYILFFFFILPLFLEEKKSPYKGENIG